MKGTKYFVDTNLSLMLFLFFFLLLLFLTVFWVNKQFYLYQIGLQLVNKYTNIQ